jgi:hypothetical protein
VSTLPFAQDILGNLNILTCSPSALQFLTLNMRLLSSNANGSFSLNRFTENTIPSHAILSHVWEADDQEVTFHDLINHLGSSKKDYRKIQFCSKQAGRDSLQYFWVDSLLQYTVPPSTTMLHGTAVSAAENDGSCHLNFECQT